MSLYPSAPPIMLSRFLIHLREINRQENTSSSVGNLSRFSVPNFRVPTMDDVVGNLGDSLDFVEYDIDNEDTITASARWETVEEARGDTSNMVQDATADSGHGDV